MLMSCSIQSEETDFRGTTWGMSPAEVQKSERRAFDEEIGMWGVYYEPGLDFFGSETDTTRYYFGIADMLVFVDAIIVFEQTDETGCASCYAALKEEMEKAYGEPVVNGIQDDWKNNDFQSDAIQQWFDMFKDGDFFTAWQTERSKIAIAMMDQETRRVVMIMYDSVQKSFDTM